MEPDMKPEDATYWDCDWKSCLHLSGFKLKYFADAATTFQYRYDYAFAGAFRKILTMLKDKPEQVPFHAHDFSQLVVLLRGAADNLHMLADAIDAALSKKIDEC